MSTAELIFAFHVRQLASDLRSAAKAAYYASIYQKSDGSEHASSLAQWDREHPIEMFLDQAASEVEHVASYLAQRLPAGEL